jgi:hypothetical protein
MHVSIYNYNRNEPMISSVNLRRSAEPLLSAKLVASTMKCHLSLALDYETTNEYNKKNKKKL